jgi:hypothetical protein
MRVAIDIAAQGRASRFLYSQAAQIGIPNLEIMTRLGRAMPDVVAGDGPIQEITGYALKALDVRGSILPALGGGWVVAMVDPRTPLNGDKRMGFKSMTQLVPTIKVDLCRAETPISDVPMVRVRAMPEVLKAFRAEAPAYLSVDIEGKGTDVHLVGLGWSPDVAYVVAWQNTQEERDALSEMLRVACPILHNAAYDVPELEVAGVPRPAIWEDTMVLAALYNPTLKKGLEQQTLAWVDGATAWKKLVNHKHGYEYVDGKVATYRRMWTNIMERHGRTAPRTPWHWYCFYNGLDVAYTYRLHAQLRAHLEAQG